MLLNRSQNQAPTTKTEKSKEKTSPSTMTSLKDLLALNKSQMCTYEYSDPEGGSVKGVTYISGGKMRGDFTTTANGKSISGAMVKDSKFVYTWSPDTKQGFKMEVTEVEKSVIDKDDTTTSKEQKTQSIDEDTKYDYKCSNWTTDSSKFTPPSDIKFTDYSAMIKQIAAPTGSGTNSGSNQCAACTYLTGDQKTSCLKQLNCQ